MPILCRRINVFVFVLFSLTTHAQTGVISGLVLDSMSYKPIPYANVFLSNATKGTQTNSDGFFILEGIKYGQYDLVASYVGFSKAQGVITVSDRQQNVKFYLSAKPIVLKEITIGTTTEWANNYARFKTVFIGQSENAASCKILNPDVLNLLVEDRILKASTDEFLLVENKQLGYLLKYILADFHYVPRTGELNYYGQVLFEELKGSASQTKKWKQNRLDTYLGSSMHFFRTLIQTQLVNNGFIVHPLIRKKTEDRPADSLINLKIDHFRKLPVTLTNRDSLNYWLAQFRKPPYIQILKKDTLTASNIADRSAISQQFTLSFKDCLYIIYNKKKNEQIFPGGHKPAGTPRHPVTIMTLKDSYAIFDSNGILLKPMSVSVEGA